MGDEIWWEVSAIMMPALKLSFLTVVVMRWSIIAKSFDKSRNIFNKNTDIFDKSTTTFFKN